MGPFITKILMETNQPVPEFLEQFKPDGEINFDEEDPDFEAENDTGTTNGDGDAWGGDNNAADVPEPAWGTEDSTPADAWNAPIDSAGGGAW